MGPSKSRPSELKQPSNRQRVAHRVRGFARAASQTEAAPRAIAPLPNHSFRSTPAPQTGQANSNTPNRRATAGPCISSRSAQASYTHQSHQSTTAAPRPTKQSTMDIHLESELRDTIFHDPKFVERFLSGAAEKLQAIEQYCRTSDRDYNKGRWSLPKRVSHEEQLYQPIVNILNRIKNAVDNVHGYSPSMTLDSDSEHSTPELFINNHDRAINSDLDNTSKIKPDVVLFQDSHRHWESVRMPVEVKKLPGHHKAGMKQLSRYARAVFAHQLHRRHLYGMMVCGTEATFVRFDRAGILYSSRVDIVEQSEIFTRACASLLMLDRIDEGFDPAFTFERDEKGRLLYYIHLSESELTRLFLDSTPDKTGSTSTSNERMRQFKVVERLCHRQSICGRATIVLRIQEVPNPEQQVESKGPKDKQKEVLGPEPREYALKIIWRDPARGSEGDVLKQVLGMFGLAQYAGHWDVSMPGKCRCPTPVVRCKNQQCVDKTVEVDGLEVCDKLRDISILVPGEVEGEEQELEEIDTTKCHTTSHVRPLRVYSYVLMSSIGIPLWRAESPRRFMTAVLDAMLGYWGLFNIGIMHRDISDGNVMILSEEQEFARREWQERRKKGSNPRNKALVDSEKKLRKVLNDLGRPDPTGMLSDFDLHAPHSSPSNCAEPAQAAFTSDPATRTTRPRDETTASAAAGAKRRKSNSKRSVPILEKDEESDVERKEGNRKRRVIDYRTGTPAFMSTRVLRVPAGQPYHHSFLDDLESFYWLIFWSAAAHLDDGKDYPTATAQNMLNKLNHADLDTMSESKTTQLTLCFTNPHQMAETLHRFGNEWASDGMFHHVILKLGSFLLTEVMPEHRRLKLERSPGKTFLTFTNFILEALALSFED